VFDSPPGHHFKSVSLVIGTEPAQTPIGNLANISDPWLEYARLRTYGDEFARALEHIARQPIRELKAERLQVPLQYVRRADRQTALTALRSPHIVTALGHGDPSAALIEALPLFDVPVTRQTLDSAANRCIATITRAVARRAIRLRSTLGAIVEKESLSTTRSDLASRWLRRKAFLDKLVGRLRHAQSISPLSDVTRTELSAAGLNAVSADPKYARAYRLGWRILRHGIEGPPDTEKLWISPTWEIYERWCFVRISTALKVRLPKHDWRITRKHSSHASAALVGADQNEDRVELLLQPRFPAGDSGPRAGFHSISGMREPDIVITFQTKDEHRWVVLDAKYRTTRANVLDAMSSAHIYRDALRFRGEKPMVSLLLVPRAGGAPWLEDEAFMQEHSVGIWSLDHASDANALLNSVGFAHRSSSATRFE